MEALVCGRPRPPPPARQTLLSPLPPTPYNAHACPLWWLVRLQLPLWGSCRKLLCHWLVLNRSCKHQPTLKPTCTCVNIHLCTHINTRAHGHMCCHTLYIHTCLCMFRNAHMRPCTRANSDLPTTHLCMYSRTWVHKSLWTLAAIPCLYAYV